MLLDRLTPPVRNWFKDKFPDFTDPQKLAIPAIMDGDHLLLCSPTGSGKTLTAFLTVIDRLVRASLDGTLQDRVMCMYISPIKALANDIQRNLIGPLEEIKSRYLPDRAKEIRVGLRTGDTSQSERQRMLRKPPHILITTPESLAIAISSKRFQPIVSEVEFMIIDELHSLVPTKRGVHLSLAISHLDTLLARPVQRIGISATMEPLETVAEYLVSSDDRQARGREQSVSIAKVSGVRALDLDILLCDPTFSDMSMKAILERNVDVIAELIAAHTTTLVFANTRKMTENLVKDLRPMLGDLVAGHHGSMDKKIRLDVEQRLKHGELRAVVTSSSLEMGIDIGSVDLVIQVGSPGDIATALQRIGRAGHHVGGIPRARILPTGREDLIECAALQAAIQTGMMDRLEFPQASLDVLAQYLIGFVILGEQDIDEIYEVVVNAWSYRNLSYDDFIEVLDMLDEERRIWIDWEENIFGVRGYSRMIYYTNIGTIAPDNSYLVFNAEGSILGTLSASFVANLKPGEVILLGGSTYRIHTIRGTKVNVQTVTGHRPTVPSWSGEARSRSRELSSAVLDLIGNCALALRKEMDPMLVLTDAYGLSNQVASAIDRYLREHAHDTMQVPSQDRILVEELMRSANPTYLITTCRGLGFNKAMAYLLGGMCEEDRIAVLEVSFDENALLLKTGKPVDIGRVLEVFQRGDHLDLISKYLISTQLFAKRFREVAGRSLIIPRRRGGEELSPQQFQQRAEALFQRHRTQEDSLLMREARNEVLTSDIDVRSLEAFLERMQDGTMRICEARMVLPSKLGMSLYASAFEDLLSMRTRAYLIKDIDPEILRRLLGQRSLAAQLTKEDLASHYADKVPIPTTAEDLFNLMEHGGGLEPDLHNPLYREKLTGIPYEQLKEWVRILASEGHITKVNGTGVPEIDGRWFSSWMADVHGTLAVLSANGAEEVDDLRELHLESLSFKIASAFEGTQPTQWQAQPLIDPHEALRTKIIEMLGTEGPTTNEELIERLPFPNRQVESILHELEVRNVISVGFYTRTDEAEFILRIDEHRITGGAQDVVEYRGIQSAVLNRSFKVHGDAFEAFDAHLHIQKHQELLHRVDGFRYGDWLDLQVDSDVIMGRLIHNRVGYTTRSNLPLLMSLRADPYMNDLDRELLDRVPSGRNVLRTEILADYPKGDEHRALQRELKNALGNLERRMLVVKQFEASVGRKRRVSWYHRVHEDYEPMPFQAALKEVIKRLGPVRMGTLRLLIERPNEEISMALNALIRSGEVASVYALVPEPEEFYCLPGDVRSLRTPQREDRTIRILTQSDPYVSRFIWEVRSILRQGWYLPVFKGVDPIGKILMYKVNDYLEIKDMQIPNAYLPEFLEEFVRLLDHHSEQLVDVAVLHQFNGEPIVDLDELTVRSLEDIGFRHAGDRMIRGGVVDPQPRTLVDRALFLHHHLHQQTRLENETLALETMTEVRDDFALRGRCELFRVDLKSMASAHQLHTGVNLRGHQVWAKYEHFSNLLAITGNEPDEDLLDVLEFFHSNSDPGLFKEREALTQAAFRKLIQPLLKSGHLVQDFRGGFRTVIASEEERRELRRQHLRAIVADHPVITIKQFGRIAGTIFTGQELKSVLNELEASGDLVKGFLIQGLHEVCWGWKDALERAEEAAPVRDFVLPPSDVIAPYFADILRQRFGFGSAYMVFRKSEAVAAFKANTRDKVLDVTDWEGEESAWRIVKEFAWEHQMPLQTDLRIGGKRLRG